MENKKETYLITEKNPSRIFEKFLIEKGFKKLEKRIFFSSEEFEKCETFTAFKTIVKFNSITGENLKIN